MICYANIVSICIINSVSKSFEARRIINNFVVDHAILQVVCNYQGGISMVGLQTLSMHNQKTFISTFVCACINI